MSPEVPQSEINTDLESGKATLSGPCRLRRRDIGSTLLKSLKPSDSESQPRPNKAICVFANPSALGQSAETYLSSVFPARVSLTTKKECRFGSSRTSSNAASQSSVQRKSSY